MDKKITKAIIGIAILIALYFLNVQQQNSYKNSGSSFLNIEKDLIKKVIISANEDAIEFSTKNDSWVISGNDSLVLRENKIEDLLLKLSEIKQLYSVTNKEEKWNLYGVDPVAGTHLALVGDGGNTLAYYVFGQGSEYNKCYVRTDQNMEVLMLDSNIMFQLRTDPNFWGEVPKPMIPTDSLKTEEINN